MRRSGKSQRQNDAVSGYVPGGRNVIANRYIVTEGNPPIPDRANFIGVLKGNWHQIGWEAGKRSGDSVRVASDVIWETLTGNYGVEKTLREIKLYEAEIRTFMPDYISFMQGIAGGASEWLSKSKYAAVATNYERVLIGSVHHEMMKYHPPEASEGCSAFAAKEAATVNRVRIHAHNRHTPYNPLNYQQIYIARPNKGNSFWVLCNLPAAIGNHVVNNKGVSACLLAGGGGTNPDSSRYTPAAFGVSGYVILAFIGAYANDAQDAIRILTVGTEAYRKATGRNSLLRTGSRNFLISDAVTLAVVEVSPERYAVRYPGDFTPGWEDKDFIVATNHHLCHFSYDKDNKRTEVPMTVFTAGRLGSVDRFWTLMWDIKHHYGAIDEYTAMHIMGGSYKYHKDTGEKIEAGLDEKGNPAPWYKIGECTDPHPDLSTGTNDGKIAVFHGTDKRVYWTSGNVCHWEGDWDSYSFRKRRGK
jgi:hypothetical protein